MGDKTGIQWTDATWNPVTGCAKVSQGCKHCYAERVFPRVYGSQTVPMEGTTMLTRLRRFTDVVTHPDRLDQPLRWKRPRRVFVNSMSDLFHEDVPVDFVLRVWLTMMHAGRHRFQILTKRPARMRSILTSASFSSIKPMPHIWLGVSVEDQATADERIPLLLQTPAAVRFVSYEPALGPVAWHAIKLNGGFFDALRGGDVGGTKRVARWPRLDWLIVGGESGPKARPFDVQWARDTIRQCKAAGVPVFCKQLGSNIRDRNDAGFDAMAETYTDTGRPTNPSAWPEPRDVEDIEATIYQGAPVRVRLDDRSGGDPAEWPEDLRVREWPQSNTAIRAAA